MRSNRTGREGGFSLLEMLVAMTILGLSLGMLYQAVSGATRNLRTDERYAYGVELARSLLAANARVPAAGTSARGETAGGFAWSVAASPVAVDNPALEAGALQAIEVVVSWPDGSRRRSVTLHSVVEGMAP